MTVFIGMPERTSGLIRGIQISQKLPNSRFISANDHWNIMNNISNETVIFIRQIDEKYARHLKNKNCKVGYDLLDRPVADHHNDWKSGIKKDLNWSRYSLNYIDFMIVNNTSTKAKISESYKGEIFIIPHHNVNLQKHKRDLNKKIECVGYIGTSDQMLLQDELNSFCKDNSLKFLCSHPNTVDECNEALQKIDIGVIFVDADGYKDYVLKYKPNTKLSNFQSYGIPTVSCKYDSFVEFGKGEWIQADNKEFFLDRLKCLLENKKFYSDLSDAGYEHGLKFHIDEIVKKYYQQFT
jgi:hypothetical protein